MFSLPGDPLGDRHYLRVDLLHRSDLVVVATPQVEVDRMRPLRTEPVLSASRVRVANPNASASWPP
jgi:hypothetical protein